MADQLPPGWATTVDAATGKKYFYNSTTQASSWEMPTMPTPSVPKAPLPVVTVPAPPTMPIVPTPPPSMPVFPSPPSMAAVPTPPLPSMPVVRPPSVQYGSPRPPSSIPVPPRPSSIGGDRSSVSYGGARESVRASVVIPPHMLDPADPRYKKAETWQELELAPDTGCNECDDENCLCGGDMMDCVQCDCANGGTEEDIAPQRLVIRALAFGLLMLGVIEVGLGGAAYAMTEKNIVYYNFVSRAAGAWWAGFPLIIAGIISMVAIDRNWIISGAVLTAGASALCLAGAITDGIMAQFYGRLSGCVMPTENCPPNISCPPLRSDWSNRLSSPTGGRYSSGAVPGYQSKSGKIGSYLDQCTWYLVNNGVVFDNAKMLSCISRFNSNDLQIDKETQASYLSDDTLSKVCFQLNSNRNAGFDVDDVVDKSSSLYAASCAFCVLGLALGLSLTIYSSMTFAWHPVRAQKDDPLFGVGAQGVN